MPKKKDTVIDEEIVMDAMGLPLHKKHKKHKHKKHKRKKGQDGEFDEGSGGGSPPTPSDGYKPGFKLKIKIGGQTFGEARVAKAEINDTADEEGQSIDVVEGDPSDITVAVAGSSNGNQPAKSGKKVDEEEAWLAALEAGRLEEVDDELRRMKDPNLMTARQRALLESKAQKEKDDVVPAVVPEEKELTEEMIQRRIIKAKKRKQQAEEKREKDKKQTIERLLKKTDAKVKGSRKFMKRSDAPKITYIYSQVNGPSLSLPPGINFPLQAQVAKVPPMPVQCGVEGCFSPKKYSCSKTGVPLCSLSCYRKNLSANPPSATIHVA